MQITYLGHAGFCVETKQTIIIMDPWLSKYGAFDSSWFQYPKNHHLDEFVESKLRTENKDKYIYISHEHKDHFDPDFLHTLTSRDFTIVLADFDNPVVKNTLVKQNYQCKDIISLKDNEIFQFRDGFLTLFLIDMELDCDSAILVNSESKNFLNLNDCKIHERLADIANKYGKIDIFSEQFSGAIWHPTCYHMKDEVYKIVAEHKKLQKFEAVAQNIDLLKPAMYLPSAGPACFLDPLLFHIHEQEINTYPRAPQFIDYLNTHFAGKEMATQWPDIMPGDSLNVDELVFTELAKERVEDKFFYSYIKNYANEYKEFFEERAVANTKVDPKQTFINLKPVLIKKLAQMKDSRKNLPLHLYWAIEEYKDEMYCIDFGKGEITVTNNIEHPDAYYLIKAPAWQVNKVLVGELCWPDFALTFRVSLERHPDIYNTLIHGFLILEPDTMGRFCDLFTAVTARKARINVECQGKKYSVLRYCPHQGGDLMYGSVDGCFLVCPRHHWKFDLENEGKCRYNNASIGAICLDDESESEPLLQNQPRKFEQ